VWMGPEAPLLRISGDPSRAGWRDNRKPGYGGFDGAALSGSGGYLRRAITSALGARHDPNLNALRPGLMQRGGKGVSGCAAGHHVVDDRDVSAAIVALHGEGSAHILAPLGARQLGLRASSAHARNAKGIERQSKPLGYRPGKFERLVVATPAQSSAIERHWHQHINCRSVGSCQFCCTQVAEHARQVQATVILQSVNKRIHRMLIAEHRACHCEGRRRLLAGTAQCRVCGVEGIGAARAGRREAWERSVARRAQVLAGVGRVAAEDACGGEKPSSVTNAVVNQMSDHSLTVISAPLNCRLHPVPRRVRSMLTDSRTPRKRPAAAAR